MATLPLTGVRIVDLTAIWAGPYATMHLADQGAEVIKVESPRNWDNLRTLFPPHMDRIYRGEEWWNTFAYYQEYNRNKKSLALDFTHPKGLPLFARLVACSDVVIENYRSDVMDKLGLTYDWLRRQRRDIIVVGMAGFGKTGPEKDALGYGPILEQMGGVTALTGYGDDGVPYKTGISYGDPVGGVAAAAAVATALVHRQRHGEGQYVDLAQREVMTTFIGEAFMDWSMNHRLQPHRGNDHDWMAPHGVFPCVGPDAWVAIAVRTDGEWEGLKRALGSPAWAAAPAFADQALRWEHRDALNERLSAWTRTFTKETVFDRCRAQGVPAGPVWTTRELLQEPHLRARGFYERTHHPDIGPWLIHGRTWRRDGQAAAVRHPAPNFGQHNHEVLGGLLGLSAEEIAALEAEGVVADAPQGVPRTSDLLKALGR